MRSVSATTVDGVLTAPPSKSYTQRALAAAALSSDPSILRNPSTAADSRAAAAIAAGLGAVITENPDGDLVVEGLMELQRQHFTADEAGLCMRMFAPILTLFDEEVTLTARGSLLTRPVEMVVGPLNSLGARVRSRGGLPPLNLCGPLRGGHAEVDGSSSSQHITGLLLATPRCAQDTTLHVIDLKSRPYVAMTVELLRAFGVEVEHDQTMSRFEIRGGQTYSGVDYTIEGDWSGAAFLLVAGALAGRVTVRGLHRESLQADRRILHALDLAGASVTLEDGAVSVATDRLRGFNFDATDCPDLFPPLVALAARCDGVTTLKGLHRLRDKESDRRAALIAEFRALGISVEVEGDTFRIRGGRIKAGVCDAHGDHRIAMAVSIAVLGTGEEVSIRGWPCVGKSYPSFFDDLASLGAVVR